MKKCPTCGSNIKVVGKTTLHYEPVEEQHSGLIPLNECQLHEFYYNVCPPIMSPQTAQFIKALCEKFGTRKEISEDDLVNIIKNDIVGKSALENWGVKEGDNFMQIGEISYNRFYRLVKSICAKIREGK